MEAGLQSAEWARARGCRSSARGEVVAACGSMAKGLAPDETAAAVLGWRGGEGW